MTEAPSHELANHRGTIGAGGWLWYLGGLAFLAGVVGLVSAGAGGVDASGQPIEPWIGVVAIVVGLALLSLPVARFRQRVVVYSDRVVHRGLFRTRTLRPADLRRVQHVVHHRRHGTLETVALLDHRGVEHRITGIDGARQLANLLTGMLAVHASFAR